MLLAQRLDVPLRTSALLCDMDGVLIDSLALDYAVVGPLLESVVGPGRAVPREAVRRWFPLAIDDFWAKVAADLGIALTAGELAELVRRHEAARIASAPVVHDGITEILTDARRAGLATAVVSNNPHRDVEQMLAAADLLEYFDAVVGNDRAGLARKPAPDPYLAAAAELDVPPADCVAIEDSVSGLESARRAECYTVGVATGAATFETLASCGQAHRCFTGFTPQMIQLTEADGSTPSVDTTDEFVSHLVRLLTDRLGYVAELRWPHDDWRGLGSAVGQAIHPRLRPAGSACVAGTFGDGGSVEAYLGSLTTPGLTWHAGHDGEPGVPLREPVTPSVAGRHLAELLDGLAQQARLALRLRVRGPADSRPTWSAIYAAVGTTIAELTKAV